MDHDNYEWENDYPYEEDDDDDADDWCEQEKQK